MEQQEQLLQSNDKTVSSEEYRYNPRKPKWWNKLGNNGRGATKAQKRCMKKILDGDDGIDNDGANNDNGNNDNDANVDNDNRGGRLQFKLKLRLPTVEYGSKLNWDDVFDIDTDTENGIDNNGVDDDNNKNNNKDKDKDRDIWLELGFGRGENISSLLDLKLLNKHNNSKSNNFYFIGAEVSSIGIGCLCKQIDQRFNNKQNNSNNDNRIIVKNDGNDNDDNDKGYVLYHPELDPYYRHDRITDKEVVIDECSNTNNNEKEKEKNQYNNGIRDVDHDHDVDDYSLQKLLLQNHFRIHTGDGYKLLFKIPTNTLANILITFPDPFEKLNDTQYRLIQKQTLLECYRILRKNTTSNNDDDDDDNGNTNGLLFLATDHEGYYDWCHQMIDEVNNDNNDNGNGNDNDNDTVPGQQLSLFRLVEPCPNRENWLPAISRYEQKGWTEGRSTKLSCWQVVVVQ